MRPPYWMQYNLRHLHAAPEDAGGGVPATPPATPEGSVAEENLSVESDLDDPVLDAYLDGAAEGKPAAEEGAEAAAVPPVVPSPPAAQPTPQPVTPPVAPPAAPEAAPPVPTPQGVTPAAPVAPAAAAPPVESLAPAPLPTPAPAAPAPAPARPAEEVTREREAARTKYLGELEAAYQVPQEERDALLTSPEAVLPKLAARVHLQVSESVINAVIANLPQLVGQINTQERAARENEEAYYAMWPALKDDAGKAATNRMMLAYYQASAQQGVVPKREQAMREVGIAVMTTLQRPIALPGGAPAPAAAAPPQVPFVPAGPGGAGAVPGSRPQLGVWQGLAEELLEEDRQT